MNLTAWLIIFVPAVVLVTAFAADSWLYKRRVRRDERENQAYLKRHGGRA